jgi:hypothetical protein
MKPSVMRPVFTALLGAATVAWLAPGPAFAQQIKGPTSCFKCHKPQAKSSWETEAPFHKKSIEQLSAPKAAAYAAAIGLASPTTITGKGDCVSCHASVVGGAPSVGVSCESCHGPASGYYTPHQEPEFYDKPEAQRLGLRDLFNKSGAIAQMCVNCHVTPDPRLKKAGHPAGEAFDPGKGIAKMVHWDSDISVKRKRTGYGPALYAQISADARPLAAKRLASAGPAVASGPTAPSKTAAPAGTAPAAAPPAGAATTGAPKPAAAAPPAAPAPKPRPAGTADPFDWDQPVAPLPADYPSDGGTAAAPAEPEAPSAESAGSIADPAVAPIAPPPPRPAVPRAPSTAPEAPAMPIEPLIAPPPPPLASKANVRTPAERVAESRGRAAVVLAGLLKSKGAKQLDLRPPAPPREFQGPDSELFRLQDEILYLALETLRRPQP